MRHLILAALLLVPQAAHAGRVVMSYSDSRGNTGNAPSTPTQGSWPQILDAARADFTVCNRPHNGWTSADGVANVAADYAACAATGTVTDVLILFGVNDLLLISGTTSAATAARVMTIADFVEAQGARAWIVLEPPGPIAWGGYTFMDARKYTRDDVDQLQRLGGAGYRFIDVRDEFQVSNWYATTCSSDQLHPTGLACRQLIANAVSAAIP